MNTDIKKIYEERAVVTDIVNAIVDLFYNPALIRGTWTFFSYDNVMEAIYNARDADVISREEKDRIETVYGRIVDDFDQDMDDLETNQLFCLAEEYPFLPDSKDIVL